MALNEFAGEREMWSSISPSARRKRRIRALLAGVAVLVSCQLIILWYRLPAHVCIVFICIANYLLALCQCNSRSKRMDSMKPDRPELQAAELQTAAPGCIAPPHTCLCKAGLLMHGHQLYVQALAASDAGLHAVRVLYV